MGFLAEVRMGLCACKPSSVSTFVSQARRRNSCCGGHPLCTKAETAQFAGFLDLGMQDEGKD